MRKRRRTPHSRSFGLAIAAVLLLAACDRHAPGDRERVAGKSDSRAELGALPPRSADVRADAARQMVAVAAVSAPSASAARSEGGVAGTPRSGDARAFAAPLAGAGVDPAGAMLVRQGQASIEVRRLGDAVPKVRAAAAQLGGFVANATIRSGRDETNSATLELRVPTDRFDALVNALDGLGRVESVAASAQDVGDEYVDLAARAANARRVEARLTEMLATRTGKLSDVLTLEQELARVREEIERYQARLAFLQRRTALSTLDITLHEPIPLIERQPGSGPLAEAVAAAWVRAIAVLAWCIASLGFLVPAALVGAAVLAAVRWAGHRRASRVRNSVASPAVERP